MNLATFETIARKTINDHNLSDWNFKYDRAVRRYGCCNYRTKTISMSSKLVGLNEESKNMNTLLHEIAHALAGKKAGHGYDWKKVARRSVAVLNDVIRQVTL